MSLSAGAALDDRVGYGIGGKDLNSNIASVPSSRASYIGSIKIHRRSDSFRPGRCMDLIQLLIVSCV